MARCRGGGRVAGRPCWTGTALRDWTRARSAPEALKSEIHLHLARAGDYRGADRNERLAAVAETVGNDVADLLGHSLATEPARHALPDVHDVSSYFAIRVGGRIDGYYRPRARELQIRLKRLRAFSIGLSAAAVVLGVLAARFSEWGLASWIAVVTTIAAAVSAHVGGARYEYQLIEYLRTAGELSRLRATAARVTAPETLDELVVQCERVISIQNDGWMAKLTSTSDGESEASPAAG